MICRIAGHSCASKMPCDATSSEKQIAEDTKKRDSDVQSDLIWLESDVKVLVSQIGVDEDGHDVITLLHDVAQSKLADLLSISSEKKSSQKYDHGRIRSDRNDSGSPTCLGEFEQPEDARGNEQRQ